MADETTREFVDPYQTLKRASVWLIALGALFALIGVIAAIRLLGTSVESGQLGRTLRGIGAILGWLIPGIVYVVCGIAIPRRQRWAVGTAELTTYIQLFFAGTLVVMSLLQIKALWPMLIVSALWAVPLLLTPKLTAPCPRAMDLIAQLPTLAVQRRRPGK